MWLAALPDGTKNVQPTPGAEAICPHCGQQVFAKCGNLVTWHWAHKSLADCDTWAEGETDWHVSWKKLMPSTEVTIERDGVTHRADGLTASGTVVEFQHSSISTDEIAERERFYGRMVWVFDARDAFANDRLELRRTKSSYWLRWKHARVSIKAAKKPVYLDIGVALIKLGNEFAANRWSFLLGFALHFKLWAHGEEIDTELPWPSIDCASSLVTEALAVHSSTDGKTNALIDALHASVLEQRQPQQEWELN